MQRVNIIKRRRTPILLALAGILAVCGLPAAADSEPSRALHFHHTHTGETLSVVYWQDGEYDTDALAAINEFLRDFRTGDEAAMDPKLLDLLHTVYGLTGSSGHFEIISAYRSPATNSMLRARSSGVAKRSQHLLGKAIDVRLTDVPIETIRKVAYDLGVGGIGFYSRSNFVHLDTGRFRTW